MKTKNWFLLKGFSTLVLISVACSQVAHGQTAVRQIASGNNYNCAVFDNASLKCWGENTSGQLGLGDTTNRGATANSMGANLPFVNLGQNQRVVKVATGNTHVCALLESGRVKCWGNNARGQLGQGDTTSRGNAANQMGDNLPFVDLGINALAQDISAGAQHSCALITNGEVRCWGDNASGQIGIGAIAGNAAAIGDQANEMGSNLRTVNLGTGTSSSAIFSNQATNCALLTDGSAKCWGANTVGQTGQGGTSNVGTTLSQMGDALRPLYLSEFASPAGISVGGQFVCSKLSDSSVKCLGVNNVGQLGQENTTNRGVSLTDLGDNLPRVDIASGLPVLGLGCGGNHCCAVVANRAIKCWGANGSGQLGQGTISTSVGTLPGQMGNALPFSSLGSLYSATAVSSGSLHSCALFSNGRVKCWGRNVEGQGGFESNLAVIGTTPSALGDNLMYAKLLP